MIILRQNNYSEKKDRAIDIASGASIAAGLGLSGKAIKKIANEVGKERTIKKIGEAVKKNKKLALAGLGATAVGGLGIKFRDKLNKEDLKEGGKKVVKFAKENPQDFAIEAGSYVIPAVMLKRGIKTGNKKLTAVGGALGVLPWGTATIAAEHAIKSRKKKK